jgi:hypothetical protein
MVEPQTAAAPAIDEEQARPPIPRRTDMAKAILYVESYPSSPERLDEYNTWYNDTHLPEVVALEGFVSARRFEPVDADGPFVAIYEIDAADPSAALAALGEAAGSGQLNMSDVLQMDPVPTMRLLGESASHEPTTA